MKTFTFGEKPHPSGVVPEPPLVSVIGARGCTLRHNLQPSTPLVDVVRPVVVAQHHTDEETNIVADSATGEVSLSLGGAATTDTTLTELTRTGIYDMIANAWHIRFDLGDRGTADPAAWRGSPLAIKLKPFIYNDFSNYMGAHLTDIQVFPLSQQPEVVIMAFSGVSLDNEFHVTYGLQMMFRPQIRRVNSKYDYTHVSVGPMRDEFRMEKCRNAGS